MQEKRVGREEFFRKLSAEGIDLPKSRREDRAHQDSAGYVMTVSCGEARMEGEKFRALFGLPSACFTLQEEAGEILLQTKEWGMGSDSTSTAQICWRGKGGIISSCWTAFLPG